MEEMTKDLGNIKKRFFDSLKRGTGEAYLLMKENPKVDFSEIITKGAIKNFAYDQQCEGSRADYIYRLIKISKQKDKIVRAVLTKLQTKKKDDYGLYQMCDLAVLFHKAGYQEAKKALYKRFDKNHLNGYEFCGQEQLMKIDGVDGVLKVAEVVGKMLFEDPDDYEESWRIDDFQKQNKTLDIYKALKNASKKSKYIKAYYDSILKNKWHPVKHRKIKRFTYELIKDKIDNKRIGFLSSRRANELTAFEVEKLANEFLGEKDKQRKELYLRFFGSRKYPFDYKPIFKIASGKNIRKPRLVEYAVKALKHFQSEEIRQLALEKFNKLKNPCEYLNLLVSNYKAGDYKLLTEILNRSDNYNFIHSIAYGVIDIYRANPIAECKEPLETIYNKMNCGLHRVDIVEILMDNHVLSAKIFNELEFDSNDEIRKLFRKKKKASK